VRLGDPRERALPPIGLVELEDPETGDRVVVNTSDAAFRDSYAHVDRVRRDALDRAFRRSKVDVIDIDTGRPYVRPLMRFFQERMRRQR
jgi:uncharacterized protein (DUF58 family)